MLIPSRKTAGAAGHDLYSVEEKTIPASGSAVFDTGVSIVLPTQHYGKIEGRSSLGFAHGIVAFGGIIDEDYHGPIKVKLFNHGSSDYSVQKNDRIAQLVIQKYVAPPFRVVAEFETISARGSAGFGSTGK
jgi:dUTP pyrophosphatase